MKSIKPIQQEIKICLFIGIAFLWTGAGYLSWMYRLLSAYDSGSVDLLTEVVGYLFQVLGLLVYSLAVKRAGIEKVHISKRFAATLGMDLVCMMGSILLANNPLVVMLGLVMNLFHGLIAGFYLSSLVIQLPQQRRGMTFGLGYGLGSLGSWLLSMMDAGNFLKQGKALFVYIVLAIITYVIWLSIEKPKSGNQIIENRTNGDQQAVGLNWVYRQSENENVNEGKNTITDLTVNKELLILSCVLVFLLSLIKGVGFYFPIADLSNGVSLEFVRAFYAIGLIVAGLINDWDRKYGSIACICALIFPFVTFFLQEEAVASSIIWIVSYIFFGFFVVYRVLLFGDLSGKDKSLIWLSGWGLLWGRIGDACSCLLGKALEKSPIILLATTCLLFMATVICCFLLQQKIYSPVKEAVESKDEHFVRLVKEFDISNREKEVLQLAITGKTNGEIAAQLYISENTVKFHVKNILKKTHCAGKTELAQLFTL